MTSTCKTAGLSLVNFCLQDDKKVWSSAQTGMSGTTEKVESDGSVSGFGMVDSVWHFAWTTVPFEGKLFENFLSDKSLDSTLLVEPGFPVWFTEHLDWSWVFGTMGLVEQHGKSGSV